MANGGILGEDDKTGEGTHKRGGDIGGAGTDASSSASSNWVVSSVWPQADIMEGCGEWLIMVGEKYEGPGGGEAARMDMVCSCSTMSWKNRCMTASPV